MAPLPRAAEEAGVAALRRKRDPTTIQAPDAFFEESDELRGLFARLVGIRDASRVAIQPGVSYGVATAAKNLPLSSGQNIVITHEQFPSNVYSWMRMASELGAELRQVVEAVRAAGGGQAPQEVLEQLAPRLPAGGVAVTTAELAQLPEKP